MAMNLLALNYTKKEAKKDGVKRDSGDWHQQMQIPLGRKLVKSAGCARQTCWPLDSPVAKFAGLASE